MPDNAETGERVMEVDLERNEIRVDLSRGAGGERWKTSCVESNG